MIFRVLVLACLHMTGCKEAGLYRHGDVMTRVDFAAIRQVVKDGRGRVWIMARCLVFLRNPQKGFVWNMEYLDGNSGAAN